ncbi:hypothetical protein KBY55_24765 [Streptomyces sp. b94]|uniref:hypothetical protein n=1 Tax=Streptomyces sp. b94 TaxID=1827634 RepID=UPI001B368EE9|nr:hypothetical protein [Streptomyces sp. b94]MBQ1099183.1 hypothetical protein [Streptomyces sp. b94]
MTTTFPSRPHGDLLGLAGDDVPRRRAASPVAAGSPVAGAAAAPSLAESSLAVWSALLTHSRVRLRRCATAARRRLDG